MARSLSWAVDSAGGARKGKRRSCDHCARSLFDLFESFGGRHEMPNCVYMGGSNLRFPCERRRSASASRLARGDVWRMILLQGMKIAGCGLLIGIGVAWIAMRIMA